MVRDGAYGKSNRLDLGKWVECGWNVCYTTPMNSHTRMNGVYLLHRTTQGSLPLSHHATHYLGSSADIASRLEAHRSGRNGANLVRVWNEAGADWVVARVWLSVESERALESRLKGRKAFYSIVEGKQKTSGGKNNRKLCPCCHGELPVDLLNAGLGGVRVYAKPGYRKAAITMMKRYGKWDRFTTFETDDGRYGLSYGRR